jgi:hypothetical protein
MQTVVETPSYLTAAKDAGMTDAVRQAVVDALAKDPDQGIVIKGTGGFRKVRVAAEGKGKSGSFRVVWFFSGPSIPIFLITVFAKNDADNLTQAERNTLAKMAKTLVDTYAAKAKAKKGQKR